MMTDTTFDNFAEYKLKKVFKNNNPIVIPIADVNQGRITGMLKDVEEAGKQASIKRNES